MTHLNIINLKQLEVRALVIVAITRSAQRPQARPFEILLLVLLMDPSVPDRE